MFGFRRIPERGLDNGRLCSTGVSCFECPFSRFRGLSAPSSRSFLHFYDIKVMIPFFFL